MIDIRISKKKNSRNRSGGASGSVVVSRSAYAESAGRAAHADEATHALDADNAKQAATAVEATHASSADRATNATNADEALHALQADNALQADTATRANDSLLWNGETFADWLTQPVREGDTVTFAEVVTAVLRSPAFVSGLFGEGYALESNGGETQLTVDRLTVRQTMVVMEMLAQRVRSIGGTLVVSAANGRIASVSDGGDKWVLTFETDHSFIKGDYLRCADGARSWWAEAREVSGKTVAVNKSECEYIPFVGDEPVLLGSKNTTRQNAILISATDDGEPRIDVLGGICEKSLDGCLRARFGELGNIVDPALNPHGVGLYSDNAFLRGEFVLSTGENILTKFAVTEGRITSEVQRLREECAPISCLNNGQFMDGSASWILPPGTAPLVYRNKWMAIQGKFLALTKKLSAWISEESLWLDDGVVIQKDMAYRPKEESTVRIAITIEPLTSGELEVKLGENIERKKQLAVGAVKRHEYECKWNGVGSFSVSYTGRCRIVSCAVSVDVGATLKDRYATLFEQSEKLIKLSSKNFADDGTVLSESSIAQTAESISAKVSDNIEGALRQTGIDIRTGEVTVSADKISFTDNSGQEQALIKDGRVNAAAVDVKEVVVHDAMNPQKCVEIKPTDGDIVIRDSEGRECQRLTGDNCEDAAAHYFGTDGEGALGIVFPDITGTKTYNHVDDSTRTVVFPISDVWHNNSINDVLWKDGTLTLSAKCEDFYVPFRGDGGVNPVRLNGVNGTATLVVQSFSDEALTDLVGEWPITLLVTSGSLSCEDADPEETQATGMLHYRGTGKTVVADLTGLSTKTTKGQYFRIAVRLTYAARYLGCSVEVKWLALQAESITEAYASHFFANGFALGTTSKNFVTVWNAEGGMQLLARNGDAGMKFDSQGLQVLKNGQWIKL